MHDQEIAAVWNKISDWLVQHAPNVHKNLHPGATQSQLEKLEEKLDCIGLLPEEFKESYKIHNGGSSFFFRSHYFLTVDEIVEEWKTNKGAMQGQGENENSQSDTPDEEDPDQKVRGTWFDIKWIPFTRDGGGGGLYIDLNPAQAGKVGQVVRWDHEGECDFVADSFTDYLKEFADELLSGKYNLSDDGKDLELEDSD